jgi:hypothetical protein
MQSLLLKKEKVFSMWQARCFSRCGDSGGTIGHDINLIAFSNNEFYGDLIIFPSAYHDDPSLGVKHHFVPDGVFENSRNPREAAVVVEAVLEHNAMILV